MASPAPTRPTFEHHQDGFGVSHVRPRISWKFLTSDGTTRDWVQTGYELEVQRPGSEKAETYNIEGSQSVLVPWPSAPLQSRQSVTVRVRSFGKASGSEAESGVTSWSEPSIVETALLKKADWTASFITAAERVEQNGTLQPVRFWKNFQARAQGAETLQARLYITALGVFEVQINGQLVSNECLAPGWTSYKHRLTYRTIDVGHFLKPGSQNTICIHVGEGWYAGRLGFKGGKKFWYGDQLAALAQLEMNTVDGLHTLGTDDSWTYSTSAIQSSGIYDGEVYAHSQEAENLALAPSLVKATKILPWPEARLVTSDSPAVRVIESRNPEKVFQSPSGKTLIDFGQNLVGKLLVKDIHLPEGAHLIFRHAEVLEHGELGTRPLRFAKATDTIVGSGREIKEWSPTFTFHGFRYVEVEFPRSFVMPEISALVIHSDMKRRGHFSCSNKNVNRLHENVIWSTKGNFLSIPTDCPQRDERLGWTGDIQVFSPTASFLYDTLGFLTSWLEDVADEQLEEGRQGIPPLVVPDVIPPNWPQIPQAVWDDVTVLTPHDLYQASGDSKVLDKQFESMRAWVDRGIDRGPDGLWNFDRWQLGDWLDPGAPPEDPGNGRTDGVLVADAYLVHVTSVLAKICSILGKHELSSKYQRDAKELKERFQHKYITPAGNLMANTQTAISLAVCFDLYAQAEQVGLASAQLDKLVRMARFRIATGFAGTPLITKALTDTGRPQLAYRMLLEKTCPSWLYPVTMGATTIWERWNSMLPNGDINPGQMTSFNHYALGAVANWLHSTVGGISPLEPSWKVFLVRPIPGGNLTSADVNFDGPYGQITCTWTWKPNGSSNFELKLTVPPNSSAQVTLPSEWQALQRGNAAEVKRTVGSGDHTFTDTFDAGEWPPLPIVASNQSMPDADIAT